MHYERQREYLRCGFYPVVAGLFLLLLLLQPRTPSQETTTGAAPNASGSDLFNRVIENQKKSEILMDQYERSERVEKRRAGSDADPLETQVWLMYPVGTGVDKIALAPDGKPPSPELYRSDLEKLEKYLTWASQEDGSSQKDAYARAARKRKERFDLLEATHEAFIFTFEGKEMRGDRPLLRYSLAPNPAYRATSRNTVLFKKVRGTIWIDEQTSQLAKVDGSVTDDFSIGLFLAKVYKGSHFMEERYEVAPGVWQATFEQYDFDGRKFMVPFSIHERTFYFDYKLVGPPKEALKVVREELSNLGTPHPPA
jgi:hypothetical protein